jgi:hypothetical protein
MVWNNNYIHNKKLYCGEIEYFGHILFDKFKNKKCWSNISHNDILEILKEKISNMETYDIKTNILNIKEVSELKKFKETLKLLNIIQVAL